MRRNARCRYEVDDLARESIIFDRRRIVIIDTNTHIIQFANQHFFKTLENLDLDYSIDLSNRTNARLYKNSIIQVLVNILNDFKFGSPSPYFFVNANGLGDHQLKLIKSCFSLLGINCILCEEEISAVYTKLNQKDVKTTTFIDLCITDNEFDTSSTIKNMKKRAKSQGLEFIHDQIFEERNNKIIFN